MLLVARGADQAAGMFRRNDLRERFGLGGVGLMAAHAQNRRIGQLWDDGSRVLGMVCQRTVAGFASNAGVLTLALHLGHVGVAGLADRVPRELDRTGTDVVQSGRAKMPILTEIRRDDRPADE